LETGTTDQSATYASGSGTDTLVFNYTVQEGDTATDLAYASDTALSGTIKTAENVDAYLTLPTIGYTGSLDYAKAFALDTTVPTITTLAASAGTKVITLTLSEAVSGTPDASDFAVTVAGASATIDTLEKSSII
jgi:hypothetical protein